MVSTLCGDALALTCPALFWFPSRVPLPSPPPVQEADNSTLSIPIPCHRWHTAAVNLDAIHPHYYNPVRWTSIPMVRDDCPHPSYSHATHASRSCCGRALRLQELGEPPCRSSRCSWRSFQLCSWRSFQLCSWRSPTFLLHFPAPGPVASSVT